MLSSSSFGMTSSSGLLCSNTVSTVARHDLSRSASASAMVRQLGMTRLIRKTESFTFKVRRRLKEEFMTTTTTSPFLFKFVFVNTIFFFLVSHSHFLFRRLRHHSHRIVSRDCLLDDVTRLAERRFDRMSLKFNEERKTWVSSSSSS